MGTSLAGGFDFEPPADPPPHATMADLKRFEREERAFNTYREHRMAICATLYQSLSPDLQNRVNQDPAAMQYKAKGEAGSLWKFIKEVIQGVRYSDAMTHFTKFKIESPDSMVSDYTKFVDSIDAYRSKSSSERR